MLTSLFLFTLFGAFVGSLAYKLALAYLAVPTFNTPNGWISWTNTLEAKLPAYNHALCSHLLIPLQSATQTAQYLGSEHTVTFLTSALRPQLDITLDKVLRQSIPTTWETLPVALKNRVYSHAHKRLPRAVDDIVDDIYQQAPQALDYKVLLNDLANSDKPLLTALWIHSIPLFYSSLAPQLIRQGALIGFGSGLLYLLFHVHPLVGATIFSLAMLYTVNRMLPTRTLAAEKRHEFIASFVTDVINGEAQINALFNKKSTQFAVKTHMSELVAHPLIKPVIQLNAGFAGYAQTKQHFADHIQYAMFDHLKNQHYADDMTNQLRKLLLAHQYRVPNEHFNKALLPFTQTVDKILIYSTLIVSTLGTFAFFTLIL